MPEQFAFLEDKCKAAIIAVAMSLGVLLLLLAPASLGYGGGTITIQEAFGQFNLPLMEDEGVTEEDTTTTTTTPITPTTPTTTATETMQDPSTYMLNEVNRDALRGLIGSTIPAQGVSAGTAALTAGNDDHDDSDGHIVTGRFRLFANDTIVRRFITEMNVAAIDRSSFHNITIEQDAPHRFPATAGNETSTTAGASSSIVGRIYLDGGATPVIDNVPMTLTIRGHSLAIEDINIDEITITDPGQRDILSIIDGQTIYGIVT
jgi:hypothetical protein